jgi:hypothetical protein
LIFKFINSPTLSDFSSSCLSCPTGWEFSSYRCVKIIDVEFGDYNEYANMCKQENDGVMYKFHDVNDLKSLLADNIPSQGLYVIKNINNNLSSLQKYFSTNRLMPHHILSLENIILEWRHPFSI